MAKNTKFWKTHLAKSDDKKYAAATGEDPLEEGLKDLTWFENSRRAVKRGLHKTYETFGEEVGNSITAGVPALYLLGILPFAAINSYLSASAKPDATQTSRVMSLGTVSGAVMWALEAAMALAGVLVTALAYHTKVGKGFSYFIYALMGWLIIFRILEFYNNSTPRCFWLLITGAIVYTVGIFFAPSSRRFKFSHMVWHLFALAGVVLHVLGFVYFFG